MTTLLRYELTTDQFPLQASPASGPASGAKLTVVASNPNPEPGKHPVTLDGVSITIPVGPSAADLTADAAGVGPVAPTNWRLKDTKSGAGAVTYSFQPLPGKGAVGKEGLAFAFNNVKPNTQPGPCVLTVKEGKDGKQAGQGQLSLAKFPSGWGEVRFWLSTPNVPLGESTTLNWEGPEGASYAIQYALGERVVNVPEQGEEALGSHGRYPAETGSPLRLERTTVFTLRVTAAIDGKLYTAQEQETAVVLVPPPRFLKFEAQPALLNETGETSVKLSWETEHASKLQIGQHVFDRPAAGTLTVTCSEPRSFMAEAHALPGHVGLSAYAYAGVGRPVRTGFINPWASDRGEVWGFGIGPGRPLFKVNRSGTRTEVFPFISRPGVRIYEVTSSLHLTPAAGVTVAELGTARGGVEINALQNADYGPSFPLPKLWAAQSVETQPHWGLPSVSYSPLVSRMAPGITWGFKDANGALAVVWFEGSTQEADFPGNPVSLSFAWIDFSKLLAKRPQADSENEERDGTK